MMRYGSVCSGIEAASVAWHPLGWQPAFFSEIEAFPRAVLAHRFPHVPCHGDFTTIRGDEYGPIDLLVGGTPCQSFSVAGLRGGLADDRGNLALEFLRLAQRTRARWLVWENVPGVLSSNGGRDFGAILGGMVELGYGIAYRVLDAQFFGVPQRRRRVFVVGYLGDWRRAAAVLFERQSLSRHPAPRREAGQRPAPTLSARPTGGGGLGTDFDLDGGLVETPVFPDGAVGTVSSKWAKGSGGPSGNECQNMIVHSLRGTGFDASEDGTGRGTPLVPVAFDPQGGGKQTRLGASAYGTGALGTSKTPAIAFSCKDNGRDAAVDRSPTLRSMNHSGSHANAGGQVAVAIPINADALRGDGTARTPSPDAEGRVRLRNAGLGVGRDGDPSGTLSAANPGAVAVAIQERAIADGTSGPGGKGWQEDVAYTLEARHRPQNVGTSTAVRRLTPLECERLQGFPDDWTLVPYRGKPAADGPRYKAIGNSMAVPCMAWIGRRIAMVEQFTQNSETKEAAQ